MKSPFDFDELFGDATKSTKEKHDAMLETILLSKEASDRMAGRLVATGLLDTVFKWMRAEMMRSGADPVDMISAASNVLSATITGVVMQCIDPGKIRTEEQGHGLARDVANTVRLDMEGKMKAALALYFKLHQNRQTTRQTTTTATN